MCQPHTGAQAWKRCTETPASAATRDMSSRMRSSSFARCESGSVGCDWNGKDTDEMYTKQGSGSSVSVFGT
jgi:hypothetical protein